jgi:branched-chain amino acid transport system substrate-binding protein
MPKMGSIVGHAFISSIVAGLKKSGSTETEAMADGFKDATFETPYGLAKYRALDHQGTLGTFVGRTALKDGKGTMVDWRYADGADFLPPDTEVRAMRPA